jgi:hypothetical protein
MTTRDRVPTERARAGGISARVATVPSRDGRRPAQRGWHLADLVVVTSIAGAIAYGWYMGRGLTFYADDWNFVIGPVHLLAPHFGHLSLVPKVLYQVVLHLFGLGSYSPYRAMACLAFGVFCGAFYLYLRARLPVWFAAILAIGVIWFSRVDLFPPLFAVMINYTIPLTTMIGIWMLLDRRTAKADWAASGLMAVGLASSAVGVIAIVAVGVEFVFARPPIRRWLRFAPPVLLWLIWYAKYHQSLGDVGTARDVTSFALHELYYTFAAFVGGEQLGGVVLAVVVIVGIVVAVRQHVGGSGSPRGTASSDSAADRPTPGWAPDLRKATVTPRAAGAVAAAIGFAFATAISRQVLLGQVQTPDVARYLWVIGIFLVVALADCCKAVRPGPIVAVLAVAGLVFNGVVMAHGLEAQRATRLVYQNKILPLLAATQALGARSPNRILPITIVVLRAHPYLATVSTQGAPPGTTGKPVGYEKYKLIGDSWVAAEVGVVDIGTAGAATPSPARGCRTIATGRSAVVAPGSIVVVRANERSVRVQLRRYAATFAHAPIATLAPRSDQLILLPRDASPVSWRVLLSPGGASASACRA